MRDIIIPMPAAAAIGDGGAAQVIASPAAALTLRAAPLPSASRASSPRQFPRGERYCMPVQTMPTPRINWVWRLSQPASMTMR